MVQIRVILQLLLVLVAVVVVDDDEVVADGVVQQVRVGRDLEKLPRVYFNNTFYVYKLIRF
jgi:hypothetical protein